MNEDSVMLASGGEDIKLIDVKTGAVVETFDPHQLNISTLCWSHTNQMLVSTSSGGDKISLAIFKNDTKNMINIGEGEQQTCAALNPTSRYLVSGGKNNIVSLWDLKLRKIKKSYKGHKDNVNSVTFNWNSTYLVSGDSGGDILIFSIVTNQCSGNMKAPKVQAIRQLQYSHHRRALIGSVSDDGGLYLWDTNTRVCVSTFTGSHRAPATGLSFSPFNDMLIASVGLDKRIVYYDVQGKTCIKSITVDSPLTSIDFLHDGATFAVGTTRGQVLLYDLRSGDKPLKTITAHKNSVQSLRFQQANNKLKRDTHTKIPSSIPRIDLLIDNLAPSSVTHQNIDTVSSTPVETNGGHDDIITVNGDLGDSPTEQHTDMNTESNGHTVTDEIQPAIAPSISGDMAQDIFSPLREGEHQTAYSSTYHQGQHTGQLQGHVNGNNRVQSQSTNHYSAVNNRPITPTGIFSPLSSSTSAGGNNSVISNGRPYSPSVKTHDIFNSPHVNLQSVPPPPSTTPSYSTQYRRMQYPPPGSSVVNNNTTTPVTNGYSATVTTPGIHSNGHIHSPVSTPRDSADNTDKYVISRPSTTSGSSSVSQSSDTESTITSITSDNNNTPNISTTTLTLNKDLVSNNNNNNTQLTPCIQGGATHQDVGVGLAQSIQLEFIKNTVREAMDEIKEQLHKDIVNVQVEMLRQSFIQEQKLKELSEKCEVNQHLVEEVNKLRQENEILKNKF